MFDGYAAFGGVEIVNSQRAYARAKAAGAGWFKRSYPELETALGDDYSDLTTAPWYDPDRADLSARIIGVYGLRVTNPYDSTRAVPVTENSSDGAVLGTPRRGSRSLRFRVALVTEGLDALEYARAWLDSALTLGGCAQTEDCSKAEVRVFAAAPTTTGAASTLSRFLKSAGTVSGPITIEQATSRGFYYEEIEWTWTSEKPFLFGQPRDISLDIAPALQLIQDAPINWVPYPSAELTSGTVVLATNFSTNPGVEVDATGWSASAAVVSGSAVATYFTSGRVTSGESPTATACFRARIAGNGSTAASGRAAITLTHLVALTGVTTGRRVGVGIYVADAILAGAAAPRVSLVVRALFLNASNTQVGSTLTLAADPSAIGLYSVAPAALPATATQLRIEVVATYDWASSNADATNCDIRLYADLATVYVLGSQA